VSLPQNGDDFRAECRARLVHDDVHRLIQRQRFAILPVRRYCVQAINHREYAGAHRDGFTFEAIRISRAVPLFVARANYGSDWILELNPFQNLRAHHGMDLHLLEFFRGEFAGLGNYTFRNGKLANIVQHGRRLQWFHFEVGELQLFCDFGSVDMHTLQMIVHGLILRIDDQREASMVRRCSAAMSCACSFSFCRRPR
jgi:hypothetical protein